jgi:hypothetical protein
MPINFRHQRRTGVNVLLAGALALGASAVTSTPSPAAAGACVIPSFTPNVTRQEDYYALVVRTGCSASYVGNGKGTPQGTVKGVGAWAGPPNADGEFLPAAYLGTVIPGQTLPANSLVLIGVNGFKTRSKY